MLGVIPQRAALMSEIVNDPVCRPATTCFPGAESGNLNDLLLISLPRMRERHQRILWIVSLLLRLLQPETARFPAVIPLFRFRESEEFCGLQGSRCCFSGKNSEKTAAP
jgi:hypothetical protein